MYNLTFGWAAGLITAFVCICVALWIAQNRKRGRKAPPRV